MDDVGFMVVVVVTEELSLPLPVTPLPHRSRLGLVVTGVGGAVNVMVGLFVTGDRGGDGLLLSVEKINY